MKKYRPSNGAEGDMFMREFCESCSKYGEETGCPILNRTMVLNADDPGYPEEWTWTKEDVKRGIGVDGIGTAICTAFEEAKK